MATKRKRAKYTGVPFPERTFATIYEDVNTAEGETPFAEYSDSPLEDLLSVDGEPKWIATYKLVSVRKLKRVSVLKPAGGR